MLAVARLMNRGEELMRRAAEQVLLRNIG